MTRRMIVIAVTLTAAAAVASTFFLSRVTTHVTSSSASRGETLEHAVSTETSYALEPWSLFLIWVPVAVAAVPLRRGSRRFTAVATTAAAALLALFVVLTGFSVGLLYAPAAVAMIMAARHALKSHSEESMA